MFVSFDAFNEYRMEILLILSIISDCLVTVLLTKRGRAFGRIITPYFSKPLLFQTLNEFVFPVPRIHW